MEASQKLDQFERELQKLLNRMSIDALLGQPDFVLARTLRNELEDELASANGFEEVRRLD